MKSSPLDSFQLLIIFDADLLLSVNIKQSKSNDADEKTTVRIGSSL